MREDPQHPPSTDKVGRWWPPTKYGTNQLHHGDHYGKVYYCDGQKIKRSSFPAPPFPPVEHFKTYSVYFDEDIFWITIGDATTTQVGEEIQRVGEPAYTGAKSDGWHRLAFSYDDDETYASSISHTGDHRKLRFQHSDQKWVKMLFPHCYHAEDVRENKPGTNIANYGGLTGDLPLFLALVMFSVPASSAEWAWTNLFVGGQWIPHNYQHGRVERRGMVVRVYSWPPSSTTQSLTEMEDGTYGKYFY